MSLLVIFSSGTAGERRFTQRPCIQTIAVFRGGEREWAGCLCFSSLGLDDIKLDRDSCDMTTANRELADRLDGTKVALAFFSMSIFKFM